MLSRGWSVVLLAGVLSACTGLSPAVPEGYAGPTAMLADTQQTLGPRKANVFYVEAVNGRKVANSRAEVLRANRGRTLYMPPPMKVRAVPAQSGRFTIAGQAMYAPSLMDATQVVQAVSGTVEFAPEAGRRYEVQGEFRDGYAAVWIEDAESHRVVTPKIERKEAAAH